MTISKLLLISICCLLVPLALWGQAANGQARRGIVGRFDPQTRTFHPLPQAGEATAEPPTSTTFTGTVTVTITITLKSTGLTNINCAGIVQTEDGASLGTPRSFGEIGLVAATGTGSTRSCTVSIPYSWSLATQASDTMQTSYEVGNNLLLLGTPPNRNSFLIPLDTRKVPASGATTALTASVTL